MNAHVRKFAAGEFQQQSQDLLNELAKAILCLTDAQRKTEYDASLGRQTTAEAPRTLEQILVSRMRGRGQSSGTFWGWDGDIYLAAFGAPGARRAADRQC